MIYGVAVMAELGDGHRIVEWNDRSEGGRPQLGRGTDRDGVVGAIRLPRRLREAYESGAVYVAPNPFTYSTRSDTRLLEWLSLPYRDDELGGTPDDRRMLNDHAPETQVVRHENIDWLAREKKAISCSGPCMATWGAAFSKVAPWGGARLRRPASHLPGYVAQRWAPKTRLDAGETTLCADLRVRALSGNNKSRLQARLVEAGSAGPGLSRRGAY